MVTFPQRAVDGRRDLFITNRGAESHSAPLFHANSKMNGNRRCRVTESSQIRWPPELLFRRIS